MKIWLWQLKDSLGFRVYLCFDTPLLGSGDLVSGYYIDLQIP